MGGVCLYIPTVISLCWYGYIVATLFCFSLQIVVYTNTFSLWYFLSYPHTRLKAILSVTFITTGSLWSLMAPIVVHKYHFVSSVACTSSHHLLISTHPQKWAHFMLYQNHSISRSHLLMESYHSLLTILVLYKSLYSHTSPLPRSRSTCIYTHSYIMCV